MNAASPIVDSPLALLDFRPNVRGALLHMLAAAELELVALTIAAAQGRNATLVLDELAEWMERVPSRSWPGKVHEIEANGGIEAYLVMTYLAGRNALHHSAEQVLSLAAQGRTLTIVRSTERIVLGFADGRYAIHAVSERLQIGQLLVGVRPVAELMALEAA